MEFDDVLKEADRLGPWAHLATVTSTGSPHVVPVHPAWLDGELWTMTGTGSAKVRNLRSNPEVALHYQVAESTGFDSLILWGTARVHEDLETKQRLWEGVFDYDLSAFAPDGPSSPGTCFVAVTLTKAVVLRSFGAGGREEWSAA